MSEVWGLMPKAQDNNQKIDDAIAQAIANHESDSEAHLGEGEALQSHKAGAILDHKIGSVLNDKLSTSEISFSTNFDSLDSWQKVGTEIINQFPGVSLYADGSGEKIIKLYTESPYTLPTLDYSKHHFFQSTTRIDCPSTGKLFFGNTYSYTQEPTQGYGFYFTGGKIYGFIHNGSTVLTTELSVSYLWRHHVYRAQWDPDLKTIYFIVDGVQKGSITDEDIDFDIDFVVMYYLKSPNLYEAWLSTTSLFCSISV